jgi:hypothetical protein
MTVEEFATQLKMACEPVGDGYRLAGAVWSEASAHAFLSGYDCALKADAKREAFVKSYNGLNAHLAALKQALPQNFDMELFRRVHVAAVETLTESIQ